MLNNLFHFIKYNNAAVIILAVILILGGGALAAGPEAIGQKATSVQGVDNTALLAADFSAFNMDFKIENLEQDEKYYYVTYSFLDLAAVDKAWQYQLNQRTQKVSQKTKDDLGIYMAKFLAKHHEARVRELRQEQGRARSQGEQKRVEVTEYSGLIGRALDLTAKIFPGYEPVVKRELPAPAFADALAGRPDFNPPVLPDNLASAQPATGVDNLTRIYNEYVVAHPEIFDPPVDFGATSTPADATASTTPPSTNSEQDGSPPTTEPTPAPDPDAIPVISEPATVDIIELPALPSTGSAGSRQASPGQAAPEAVTPEPVTPEPAPAEPTPTE